METIIELRKRLVPAHSPGKKLELSLGYMADAWRSDPDATLELAHESGMIALRAQAYEALGRIRLYSGLARGVRKEYRQALDDLREAFDLLSDHRATSAACEAALALGDIHRGLRSYEEAHRWYEQALGVGGEEISSAMRARVLAAAGEACGASGRYSEALQYHMGALALYEETAGPSDIAGSLVAIGETYGLAGDLDSAINSYRRALDLYHSSGNGYGEVYVISLLAALFRKRGDHATALDSSLTALAIYETLGDKVNASTTLMTIGAIHEDQRELEKALQFYLLAYDALDGARDHRLRAAVLHSIGRLYGEIGSVSDAQLMLEQALVVAEKINDSHLRYQLHDSLAVIHERLGDYRRALDHHRHYADIKEELAGEERQKEIAELQVRYDIDRAEREREIFRLKAQRLEDEMRRKETELTTMALSLVQMNEMIDGLKARIKTLEGGNDEPSKELMKSLLAELEQGAGAERAWENFEQQLDNIHHEFVSRLTKRCPALAPMELKVCSLLKINLVTKDIANLLCLSARTVETHRYNIGRKLSLKRGERLTAFLAGI